MQTNRRACRKLLLGAALAAGVILVGSGGAPGEEAAAKLTEKLFIGQPIQAENVTVWAVYSSEPAAGDGGEYLTLEQAQAQKLAVVRELGAPPAQPPAAAAQQGGRQPQGVQTAVQAADTDRPAVRQAEVQNAQARIAQLTAGVQTSAGAQSVSGAQQSGAEANAQVNRLVIENKGTKSILVLAGTLVKGGRQDRQIGQDFIIPPGKTAPVDAYCVEHGRWTSVRENVNTNDVFEAQKTLALKRVRDKAQYSSDQSAVWQEVAACNSSSGKDPQTGTLMATIEETNKEALQKRGKLQKALSEAIAARIQAQGAPVGLAYAVDGKVREVRTFNDPRILRHYADTLVGTIAVEGELAQRVAQRNKQEVFSKTAQPAQVAELVQNVEKLNEEKVRTQAGNCNAYKKGDKASGAKTYAEDPEGKPNVSPVSQSWSAQ